MHWIRATAANVVFLSASRQDLHMRKSQSKFRHFATQTAAVVGSVHAFVFVVMLQLHFWRLCTSSADIEVISSSALSSESPLPINNVKIKKRTFPSSKVQGSDDPQPQSITNLFALCSIDKLARDTPCRRSWSILRWNRLAQP